MRKLFYALANASGRFCQLVSHGRSDVSQEVLLAAYRTEVALRLDRSGFCYAPCRKQGRRARQTPFPGKQKGRTYLYIQTIQL